MPKINVHILGIPHKNVNYHYFFTPGFSVITIGSFNDMADCTHEEADTRVVVHILYAIQVDLMKTILVRTVDTNVLVILLGKFPGLWEFQPELDLWLTFGMGRHFRYVSANSVCVVFGKQRCTYSMPWLDVTLHRASSGKGRSQPGRHGRYFLR